MNRSTEQSASTELGTLLEREGPPLAIIEKFEFTSYKQLIVHGTRAWENNTAVNDCYMLYSSSKRAQNAINDYFRERTRDNWAGVTFGASGYFEFNSATLYKLYQLKVEKVDDFRFNFIAIHE